MASKSKPVNQQKCRKFGLTNGPLRATQSFGLTPKKVVEPGRLQSSSLSASENAKLAANPHQPDAKDSRRSSSPESPGVLRRGREFILLLESCQLKAFVLRGDCLKEDRLTVI